MSDAYTDRFWDALEDDRFLRRCALPASSGLSTLRG